MSGHRRKQVRRREVERIGTSIGYADAASTEEGLLMARKPLGNRKRPFRGLQLAASRHILTREFLSFRQDPAFNCFSFNVNTNTTELVLKEKENCP